MPHRRGCEPVNFFNTTRLSQSAVSEVFSSRIIWHQHYFETLTDKTKERNNICGKLFWLCKFEYLNVRQLKEGNLRAVQCLRSLALMNGTDIMKPTAQSVYNEYIYGNAGIFRIGRLKSYSWILLPVSWVTHFGGKYSCNSLMVDLYLINHVTSWIGIIVLVHLMYWY